MVSHAYFPDARLDRIYASHPALCVPATRLAYAEVLQDEKGETPAGFLRRAVAWFGARGIAVERVISDNGSCYVSAAHVAACRELGLRHPAHPALPAADQRQGRALHPHTALDPQASQAVESRGRVGPRSTAMHVPSAHVGNLARATLSLRNQDERTACASRPRPYRGPRYRVAQRNEASPTIGCASARREDQAARVPGSAQAHDRFGSYLPRPVLTTSSLSTSCFAIDAA